MGFDKGNIDPAAGGVDELNRRLNKDYAERKAEFVNLAPLLIAPWQVDTLAGEAPRFGLYAYENGWCQMEGNIQTAVGPSTFDPILYLPMDYRPSQRIIFHCGAALPVNSSCTLHLVIDGKLEYRLGQHDSIHMNQCGWQR